MRARALGAPGRACGGPRRGLREGRRGCWAVLAVVLPVRAGAVGYPPRKGPATRPSASQQRSSQGQRPLGAAPDPDRAAAQELLDEAHVSAGRFAEGPRPSPRRLEHPQSAVAYAGRGVSESFLGRKQEAIEDLSRALELDPRYTHAYVNRAVQGTRQNAEAIEDFTRALELDPSRSEAYRAGISKTRCAPRGGDRRPRRRARAEPGLLPGLLGRGMSHVSLGRDADALDDCDLRLRWTPSLAHATPFADRRWGAWAATADSARSARYPHRRPAPMRSTSAPGLGPGYRPGGPQPRQAFCARPAARLFVAAPGADAELAAAEALADFDQPRAGGPGLVHPRQGALAARPGGVHARVAGATEPRRCRPLRGAERRAPGRGDNTQGVRISHYEILGELARGGMGLVRRGRHPRRRRGGREGAEGRQRAEPAQARRECAAR